VSSLRVFYNFIIHGFGGDARQNAKYYMNCTRNYILIFQPDTIIDRVCLK